MKSAAQEPEVGFFLASTFFLGTFSTSAPDEVRQVGFSELSDCCRQATYAEPRLKDHVYSDH